MIGGFDRSAFAIAPLDVQFVPDPLFVKPNFLPLDETSGTVTVTNNSGATQIIGTEAINVLDNDNFGSLLHLKIMEDSATLYDNSLAHFFTTAGEYSLGEIANGTSRTFTYTISFIDSSDNSYQGKTLGFDVCVGYLGGETHCGDTVIGDEEGGGGTGGGGGGNIYGSGGGSSGSTISLIIFNEQALNIFNVGSSGIATITWNTNLLATSQVVYGLAPGPYTLDLIPPDFGYPLYTAEDPTKVINHSMFLTGLTPGATYLYRVISRASPPTVSAEHQFTVPLLAQGDTGLVLGASTENNINGGGGQGGILGASTENAPEEDDGEVAGESVNNLAAAIGSGWDNILSSCYFFALLILLLIYLIWRLWFRRRYEKLGIPEREIGDRFYLFFGVSSFIVILILLIFRQYCPLVIFVIIFILSIGFYTYRRLRSR